MERDINDYFREITQNIYADVEEKLAKYNLVKGQAQLLLIIRDNDGCTQKELARFFNVKYSSMSQRIDKLEELGYVERKHENDNFKYNKIYITSSGKQAAVQCRRILRDIENRLFKGFTKKQITEFEKELIQILNNSR